MIRTPQQILSREPGQRVAGRWVEGEAVPTTITASVQPANASDYDYMRATLSGRRIERAVRIYTASRLHVAGEDMTNGDTLVWEGESYRVVAVSPWRTTALRHYRYLAAKELEK